uniref:Uncharacterized protein n=1 Tax=Parastrongyloides trichosuri TaxID=131310 RepID=A0A0N4Z2Q6_PARTI
MLCMGDLQRAVEDVMIKPEQNRLEDIKQRSTLEALDLCKPSTSTNSKNLPSTTNNEVTSWSGDNLLSLQQLNTSLMNRTNLLEFNSFGYGINSNISETFTNSPSISINHNNFRDDTSSQISMYDSCEHVLIRSSSSMSANVYPNNNINNIKNPIINELTLNGLIEGSSNGSRKRSNSVSSCPTKGSKYNITPFDDISEINSDQFNDSIQVSPTSIYGFQSRDDENNDDNGSDEEGMDFE